MIKLAVFDWNGTLLADGAALVDAVNAEMAVLGLPPTTLTELQKYHEIPIIKYFENIGADIAKVKAKTAELAHAFHACYEPRAARARTRSGARQLLDALQAQDVDSVILSNHTVEGIYLQLERLRLERYFKDVLANEDILKNHSVGKEQRLANYLQMHKIPAADVVIIGDSTEEVTIGHNLGMKSVVITGGYNSLARLRAAKPDAIVNKLSELTKVLEDLNE